MAPKFRKENREKDFMGGYWYIKIERVSMGGVKDAIDRIDQRN
jgi:hypothetical protein